MAAGSVRFEEDTESRRSYLPLIIGGLLLVLFIICLIGFMVLNGGLLSKVSNNVPPGVITPTPPGYMLEFDERFTTNLSPPDELRIFSAEVVLELVPGSDYYNESQMLGEVGEDRDMRKHRRAQIMERIYERIKNKTEDNINSQGGREGLRREIQISINDLLIYGEVRNVYIYGITIN